MSEGGEINYSKCQDLKEIDRDVIDRLFWLYYNKSIGGSEKEYEALVERWRKNLKDWLGLNEAHR